MLFCSNCGNEVREEDSFCSSCGKKLDINQDLTANEDNSSRPSNKKSAGIAYEAIGWVFFALSILIVPILFAAGTFKMKG